MYTSERPLFSNEYLDKYLTTSVSSLLGKRYRVFVQIFFPSVAIDVHMLTDIEN